MGDGRTLVSRASYDFMLAYLDDYPGPHPIEGVRRSTLDHLVKKPELPSPEARERYKVVAETYKAQRAAMQAARKQSAPQPSTEPAENVGPAAGTTQGATAQTLTAEGSNEGQEKEEGAEAGWVLQNDMRWQSEGEAIRDAVMARMMNDMSEASESGSSSEDYV